MYVDEDAAITMNTVEVESDEKPLPDIKQIENPLYNDLSVPGGNIEHHIYETLPPSLQSFPANSPYDMLEPNKPEDNSYDLLSHSYDDAADTIYEKIEFPIDDDNSGIDIYNSNIFK